MFVKLSFSADKGFGHIRQILNAIINNPGINSVAALNTAAASWNAAVVAGLDYSTSEIIRTVEPTNVKSHFARNDANFQVVVWTLEFQAYDAPTRKYYISFDSLASASNPNLARISVGNTIGSGSMDTGQADMSKDLSGGTGGSTYTSGTPVVLSGTAPAALLAQAAASAYAATNSANIRTFWMYLTNDCLIVAHTGAASSNLGFNATYTNPVNYTGPYIFSQYTRYDYHNTNANGVIPLIFSNFSRTVFNSGTLAGMGFGAGAPSTPTTVADWARLENVNATGNLDTAFRVFNFIDAHPQVGSSWPLTSFPPVAWGSGSRTSEITALTSKSTLDTGTLVSGQVPRLIHTTVGVRWPSSDLRTIGYAMLPLRWSNSYRGNLGGNASQRGGFYIFNGDYFPGDTFVHGGKTYIVLPTFRGYTDRVGIAVPKE
jgi:hypothetical protein